MIAIATLRARCESRNVRVVPVTDIEPARIALACHKQCRSPIVNSFVDVAVEVAETV